MRSYCFLCFVFCALFSLSLKVFSVLFFSLFCKVFSGFSLLSFLSFDDSEYTLSLKVSYPVCCSKLRRYCSYSFTFHDRDATMDWMDFIPERAGMSLPSDKKCMVYIVEESA